MLGETPPSSTYCPDSLSPPLNRLLPSRPSPGISPREARPFTTGETLAASPACFASKRCFICIIWAWASSSSSSLRGHITPSPSILPIHHQCRLRLFQLRITWYFWLSCRPVCVFACVSAFFPPSPIRPGVRKGKRQRGGGCQWVSHWCDESDLTGSQSYSKPLLVPSKTL